MFNILQCAVLIMLALAGEGSGFESQTSTVFNVGSPYSEGSDVTGHAPIGGDDTTLANSGRSECPIKSPSLDYQVLNFLYAHDNVLRERAMECSHDLVVSRDQQLRNLNDTHHIPSIYTDFCNNITTLQQCLTSLDADSKLCLDQVQQTRLDLLRGYLKTNMRVGCQRDENNLTFYERLANITRLMTVCKLKTHREMRPEGENDPNSDMLFEHELLKRSKECLVKEKRADVDTLVNPGLMFWGEVMNNMNCVHPEHGTDILCTNIISN